MVIDPQPGTIVYFISRGRDGSPSGILSGVVNSGRSISSEHPCYSVSVPGHAPRLLTSDEMYSSELAANLALLHVCEP